MLLSSSVVEKQIFGLISCHDLVQFLSNTDDTSLPFAVRDNFLLLSVRDISSPTRSPYIYIYLSLEVCDISLSHSRPAAQLQTLHGLFEKIKSMKSTTHNTDRGLRGPDESNNSRYASKTLSMYSLTQYHCVDVAKRFWITNFYSRVAVPDSIALWLAKRDKFRVVGVGHARPFPLKLRPCAPRLASDYQAHVRSQTQPILEKLNINFISIGLNQRVGGNEYLPKI